MFDTKEMQTKFISNMAERLNAMNFRARFREDGDLTVSSSINFLGVVGKTGELYCNSKDLCNPYRRFQLERILQTMDAVRTEMVQANTSTPEEALELETLLGAYPSRQQAQEEKPEPKQNEDATLKMVHEQSSEKNPSQSSPAPGNLSASSAVRAVIIQVIGVQMTLHRTVRWQTTITNALA